MAVLTGINDTALVVDQDCVFHTGVIETGRVILTGVNDTAIAIHTGVSDTTIEYFSCVVYTGNVILSGATTPM